MGRTIVLITVAVSQGHVFPGGVRGLLRVESLCLSTGGVSAALSATGVVAQWLALQLSIDTGVLALWLAIWLEWVVIKTVVPLNSDMHRTLNDWRCHFSKVYCFLLHVSQALCWAAHFPCFEHCERRRVVGCFYCLLLQGAVVPVYRQGLLWFNACVLQAL